MAIKRLETRCCTSKTQPNAPWPNTLIFLKSETVGVAATLQIPSLGDGDGDGIGDGDGDGDGIGDGLGRRWVTVTLAKPSLGDGDGNDC